MTFAVDGADGLGHEPTYRSRFPLPSGVLVAEVEKLVASPVAKLLVRHEGMSPDEFLAAALALAKDLEGLAEITFSGVDGLLEISAAGISKAFTLEHLAAEHGIGAAGGGGLRGHAQRPADAGLGRPRRGRGQRPPRRPARWPTRSPPATTTTASPR